MSLKHVNLCLPFSFLLLSGFLALRPQQAQAQAFEPGLVVVSAGDTLRGEVENSYWKEAPASIRYRASAGQPITTYRAQQLRAVSFPQGRYFRREVLPFPTLDAATSGAGTASGSQPDSLLAEVLVDGPATLMRVVKAGTAHFYVRRTGQPVVEMSARRVQRKNAQGQLVLVDGNDYRNQLSLYFIDCPTASQAVAKAKFTADGLTSVVQAYNQDCSPSRQAGRNLLLQAAPRRRTSLQGGVLLGARYNYIQTDKACLDCQLHPWAGFYADLFQPSRRTALYGELSLTSFDMQGLGYVRNSYTQTLIVYKGLIGTARLGFRFFLPLAHENQLVLGLGYELNKVLDYTLTSDGSPVNTQGETPEFVSPTLLPNLSIGWRRQRLTLMLDGQAYNGTSGTRSLLFGGSSALRASAAYRLGRHPDAARQ
jgi:hypothetical protein